MSFGRKLTKQMKWIESIFVFSTYPKLAANLQRQDRFVSGRYCTQSVWGRVGVKHFPSFLWIRTHLLYDFLLTKWVLIFLFDPRLIHISTCLDIKWIVGKHDWYLDTKMCTFLFDIAICLFWLSTCADMDNMTIS